MRAALPFLFIALSVLPARAEVPRVVTDIAVTQSLVAAVMGDLGAPVALVEAAADPHHVSLRGAQARALAEADLVVWTGGGLTPWLGGAIATLAPGAEVLALGPAEAPDIHAWLDPATGSVWIARIAQALSERDPDHAARYAANAEAARRAVDAATEDAVARLTPVRGRPIVVQHDAYGGFARAFGLTVAGAIADRDGAAPGARRIVELHERIAADRVGCVFAEPGHGDSAARRLSEDTGAKLGVLDPTGALLEPGPGLYPAVIRALAAAVADCLR